VGEIFNFSDSWRITAFHVSHCQQKSTRSMGALRRARRFMLPESDTVLPRKHCDPVLFPYLRVAIPAFAASESLESSSGSRIDTSSPHGVELVFRVFAGSLINSHHAPNCSLGHAHELCHSLDDGCPYCIAGDCARRSQDDHDECSLHAPDPHGHCVRIGAARCRGLNTCTGGQNMHQQQKGHRSYSLRRPLIPLLSVV
jgi:hypothetical protein